MKSILHIYKPGLPCILYADVSKQEIGAVLKQKSEKVEFLIAYFSRKLHPYEENYKLRNSNVWLSLMLFKSAL